VSAGDTHDTLRTWRVADVRRELGEPESVVAERACEALGVTPTNAADVEVVKRSVDARGRRAPRFVHHVDVTLPSDAPVEAGGRVHPAPATYDALPTRVAAGAARPVVVGLGPCGLFAALHLALAGMPPIVLDRGKPVEPRAKDVAALMGRGQINPESNLCFGEGGAGTWSDGKLYTRVGGKLLRPVLQSLVDMGAPSRILTDARPHLGTDKLVALLKAFRAHLIDLGCDLRFDTAMDDLVLDDQRVTGVRLRGGEVLPATHVVLAAGHSARDLYRTLAHQGVPMTPKGFAVGYRLEHPQTLINQIQYGQWASNDELPAAYYEVAKQVGNGPKKRGVYSFCMCPGGSVVPTPTLEGEVCVNGMSHAARSGRYANSAVVVTVTPEDVAPYALSDDPVDRLLAGVTFQRVAEREAWERGGGAFVAPAQRLVDYLGNTPSTDIRRTTYKRGVQAADLHGCYPSWVGESLQTGVAAFEKGAPGYVSEDAVLIGVETRTSAPVTITRDRLSLQSTGIAGLFPAGEGSGYGGGIASAAIDGIRVAHQIAASVAASSCTP
jgi:uncharacterized FAD-dependent dehydrogenase